MTEAVLNTVIHAPNRLRICALLTPLQEAEFQVIRDELGVSDSVLSKHLKQLEAAGYVAFRKGAVNGRQRMWAGLTKSGREAFSGHVMALHQLVSVSENETV
ncbi:MAG: helix-turn-helix domain-containing protein [Desulfobulbaceae bacterium]|nr:helix-turn-helix domain-containing protein [Desulfobulbaceae bacterium]